MKIVSWNCNGKFREKYPYIFETNADIYVIQECENPEKYSSVFLSFGKQIAWTGLNDNKGICILSNPEITIRNNHWNNYSLRNFSCFRINDSFDLLCVWTAEPYIEEFYIYQSIHKEKFSKDLVIIGDFNSNSIWDKQHKDRNHSAVVNELEKVELVSAYHYLTGEKQGCETQATFFHHRNPERPYHIDYCFINPDYILNFKILNERKWLQLSDHFPIQLEMKK